MNLVKTVGSLLTNLFLVPTRNSVGNMENDTSAIVYSKKGCWGCNEAKRILAEHGVPFREVDLPDVHALKMATRSDAASFPRIALPDHRVLTLEQLKEHLEEPLLVPNPERFCVYPIKYPDMWSMYKKAVASFWTLDEIDMSKDKKDWEGLEPDEQHFLKHVLAFFACADGIINENLARNFMHEVQVPEARQFYSFQAFDEAIHGETYAMLIDSYVSDPEEKKSLFAAIHALPCVRKKSNWAQRWMSPQEASFAHRLLAFICVEGIMFSGSFCAIFWMKKRGLLPGLCFSNELISRDEGLHMSFGILLYGHVKNKLSPGEAYKIVREAVDAEREFITQAIPCRLVGMNAELMSRYIEFVADRILKELGYDPMYLASNPFDFMENLSLEGKTNFFEKRVGEYARQVDTAFTFEVDDDF